MPLPSVQLENRKVGIAVDLSNESVFAVRWAVSNYLRPEDTVVLLHVQPTNVLYGADWGDMDKSIDMGDDCEEFMQQQQSLEEGFDIFTSSKAADLVWPLVNAGITYKVHIVKDHDMKERICLEAERLKLSVLIMGSRGFTGKKPSKTCLGTVSDYCARHCESPVLVVRYQGDEKVDALEAEAAAMCVESKM